MNSLKQYLLRSLPLLLAAGLFTVSHPAPAQPLNPIKTYQINTWKLPPLWPFDKRHIIR